MADLADIARELNVSSSLVSKVLSGRLGTTRVSAKTVRAIHARAEDLGYQRNVSAAALATGKQNAIGVFIHRVGVEGSGIMDATVQGIAAAANARGMRLVLNYFVNLKEFLAHRHIMHRGVMDGLILAGMHHRELIDLLQEVQAGGVPVVTIHDIQIAPQFCNVGIDNREIGRLATRHLIERGCRNIVHINHAADRFAGYKAALEEAGLPFREELVVKARNYEAGAGQAALEELLTRGVSFDGVFAQSDQLAVGFMNDLVRRGIRRVPQDVKVIGVDNSPFCNFTVIPLSSVSQSDEARGRRAVELVTERTTSREPVTEVSEELVPPVLFARESTQTTEVA